MRTRAALSLMSLFVAVVCASCAPRTTEPAAPEAPMAPAETQTRTAEADILLTDTVSTVLDSVDVAHHVPDGWDVDLEDADEGQIRMHAPDGSATIGLNIAIGGATPTEIMMGMYLHWQQEAARNSNVTVERPARLNIAEGEVWGLIVRVRIAEGTVTIAHIFFPATRPGFAMAAIGTWATELDATHLQLMGRIAGSAYIMPPLENRQ